MKWIENTHPSETMAVSLLCLVLLEMVVGSVQGQGDGLFFNNDIVPNHGIVTWENIGTSASNAVQCQTTVADCCTDSNTNTGQWFFPSGRLVSTTSLKNTYQVKGSGYVYLHTRAGNVQGMFRCEIGPVGSKAIRYVGVYSSDNGAVSISGQIEFSLQTSDNDDPPVFTLTCTSTGGPATTVTWTSPAGTGVIESQTVTDQRTATYSNTLTVTGRHTGDYTCSVSNIRTASPAVRTLTVTAASSPTGLRAIKDGTTIIVYWTPPTPTPTEYKIYFEAGASRGSLTVSGSTTQAHVTTALISDVYDITIVATSDHLPSTVVGPVKVERALFQLQIGPMERCITWDYGKAESVEEDVRKEVAKALGEVCQCDFPLDHIKTGKISCWNTLTEFTYRSAIISTISHNSTELLELLRQWVQSEPVLQIHLFQVRVVSTCLPEISSLSDPECPASTNSALPSPNSLVSTCVNTDHPLILRCVQSCANLLV